MTYRKGTLADGREVEAEGPTYNPTVTIDGNRVAVVDRPRLYRDGGTWVIPTSVGMLTFPHRLGSDDRTPRLAAPKNQPGSAEPDTRKEPS